MRTMKHLTIATVMLFTMAMVVTPYTAAASLQQTPGNGAANSITIPITGTGGGGTFVGNFELRRFVVQDGAVFASGILTGTVSAATGVIGTIARTILLPVTIGQTTCDILHLDLGPLNLDLLGLQIDLSRIVLDITAVAGAGNLLGNLLCAVANLLNDPSGLARLLNQILDILG
jgi:hypothetical protein